MSIVSCLLSLTFYGSDPPIPFFSMGTIESGIQTVVDGFLEMYIFFVESYLFSSSLMLTSKISYVLDFCRDDSSMADVIVDKLNVFRPDRVFKVILDLASIMTSCFICLFARFFLNSFSIFAVSFRDSSPDNKYCSSSAQVSCFVWCWGSCQNNWT